MVRARARASGSEAWSNAYRSASNSCLRDRAAAAGSSTSWSTRREIPRARASRPGICPARPKAPPRAGRSSSSAAGASMAAYCTATSPSRRARCPEAACPTSWASTPSTSSGVRAEIRVSNRRILLVRPRPVTAAFRWLDRPLSSATKSPARRSRAPSRSRAVRSRRSGSSRGRIRYSRGSTTRGSRAAAATETPKSPPKAQRGHRGRGSSAAGTPSRTAPSRPDSPTPKVCSHRKRPGEMREKPKRRSTRKTRSTVQGRAKRARTIPRAAPRAAAPAGPSPNRAAAVSTIRRKSPPRKRAHRAAVSVRVAKIWCHAERVRYRYSRVPS